MPHRARPAVRGWTGTPNEKSTTQHPPDREMSEPGHPGHRTARPRQQRGRAVDANPDGPGRRRSAIGCAGRTLVGDGPTTTTAFVQKLLQLSDPHCLGEVAPAALQIHSLGRDQDVEEIRCPGAASALREFSRCRRTAPKVAPPSLLLSHPHPVHVVDRHATPANEPRTDHQTLTLVSAVIGALGPNRFHVLHDPASRQG
jgi:hypothetical protein